VTGHFLFSCNTILNRIIDSGGKYDLRRKTEINDSEAETFVFDTQKTMYGGKHIAAGDIIFIFASKNEGGAGFIKSERSRINAKINSSRDPRF
jgi:hypothetical protein